MHLKGAKYAPSTLLRPGWGQSPALVFREFSVTDDTAPCGPDTRSLSTGFYRQRIRPKVHKDWQCWYPLQRLISWRSSFLPCTPFRSRQICRTCGQLQHKYSSQNIARWYLSFLEIILFSCFVCKKSWKAETYNYSPSDFSLSLLAVYTSLQLG